VDGKASAPPKPKLRKVLLLGDDVMAGLYGVYAHPVYGPQSNSGQPVNNNRGVHEENCKVRYHPPALKLAALLKPAAYEIVARAYVGANAEWLAEKLPSIKAEISNLEFAAVLVGANDLIGMEKVDDIVANVARVHTFLTNDCGIRKTVVLSVPAIDFKYVQDFGGTAAEVVAVEQRHVALNAALKAAADANKWAFLDIAGLLPQNASNKHLWDDAWHLSPVGSDTLASYLNAYATGNKLLYQPQPEAI